MRTFARFALALSLGVALAGASSAVAPAEARAQSEADLAAARKLFAEALKDEEAGRHVDALEKLRRVQEVRDTQQVRYRIARCLEATGRLRDAMTAYGAAASAGTREHESAEIARTSREKVQALSARMAHLVVRLSAHAPPDAVVKIDGEPVPGNGVGTPISVDPGPHEITGAATGAPPFRAQMTLPESGEATLDIPLDPSLLAPAPVAPPVTPPPPPPVPVAVPVDVATPAPPPHGPAATSNRATFGVVSVAAGGALLATGAVLLALRHSAISTIENDCPNGVCPLARADEVLQARDHAALEGPLGVGLVVAGFVGMGVGAYLLATPDHPATATAIHPWLVPGAGGVSVARAF